MWNICLWILVAFYGAVVLLVVFALPETSYSRPLRYETDIAPEKAGKANSNSDGGSQVKKVVTISTDVEVANEEEQPRSYSNELLPFRELYAANLLQLVLRYFSCIVYPIVWYAFLVGLHPPPDLLLLSST